MDEPIPVVPTIHVDDLRKQLQACEQEYKLAEINMHRNAGAIALLTSMIQKVENDAIKVMLDNKAKAEAVKPKTKGRR
jgi:hypothetical protein